MASARISHLPKRRPLTSGSGTTVLQPPNIRSPIFILPNELYCTIFIQARNSSLTSGLQSLTTRGVEMTISHVCSLWRSIALNYPCLWDTIRYATPRSNRIKAKDRFVAYIERSGDSLLDVWLNLRNDTTSFRREDHNEMLAVLLSQIERWRRVTILFDEEPSWSDFSRGFQDLHAVNLEHLAFCPSQDPWPPGGLAIPETFFDADAPQLRSVRLVEASHGRSLPCLNNLTTLRIEKPSLSGVDVWVPLALVLEFLAIPCLENLSISGICMTDSIEDNIGRVGKVKANKLNDLRCGGSQTIAELIEHIQLPYLQILTLRNVRFPRMPPKSAPRLTHLILLNCDVPWSAFHDELFHLSRKVTHLTISEDSDSRGNFHLYALDNFVTENCWPQLESLRCNIQKIFHVDLYLRLALDRPFGVYVHRNLIDMWHETAPQLLVLIDGKCIIQSWNSEDNPLIPWRWPYCDDPMHHPFDRMDSDPFRVASYH